MRSLALSSPLAPDVAGIMDSLAMGDASVGPGSLDEPFEAELDAFLARLESEAALDPRQAAATLAGEARRERFVGTAVAYEYLWRRERGETTRAEEQLARLTSEPERDAFRSVLESDERARRVLPDTTWVPGRTIAGRYLLLEPIGRGGMGSVFRAFDLELERDVALKMLELRVGAEDSWRQDVLAESRALASLPGRGFAQVYDIGSAGGRGFLVLELLPGLDLGRALERLAPDPRVILPLARRSRSLAALVGHSATDGEDLVDPADWFRTVARIAQRLAAHLELAHGIGLRHRDIKPSNVQLLPGGAPLLMDFGLAARVLEEVDPDAGLDPEPLRCSLAYVAPEQARSMSAGTDPRSDVYQLGLVLYELVTLQPARLRPVGPVQRIGEWLQRAKDGGVRPLLEIEPRTPRALAAVVDRALAVDPGQRYGSAGELAEDLDRFLAGRPPRHAPLARRHRLGLHARRVLRQPATLAAGLAALALAVGLRLGGSPELELAPILWHSGLSAPALLTPGEPLELRGETALGVELSSSARSWLYALSIFDDAAGVRRVRAVTPELLGSPEAPPEDRFGLEVPPGRTSAVCAWLIDDLGPFEGFLAFAAPEPQPLLERWIRAIAERDERLLGPMPWEEAQDLGRSLMASSRGQGGARLDTAARESLFAGLELERPAREDPWRRLGVRSVGFLAPVRSASPR